MRYGNTILSLTIITALCTSLYPISSLADESEKNAIPEGWPDIIKYEGYQPPSSAENPDDYLGLGFARYCAWSKVSGLPYFEGTEPLPGYIEIYTKFPKIPENRGYAFLCVNPESGIESLEEYCGRCDEAFETYIKSRLIIKESGPGYGLYVDESEIEVRQEWLAFLNCITLEQQKIPWGERYIAWTSSASYKDVYVSIGFGNTPPSFLTRYRTAEAVAKMVLGTDDVELDMICLCPKVFMFNGSGHKIYILWSGYPKYYIDDAIDQDWPGTHSGVFKDSTVRNPDGTPKHSEEFRGIYERIETSFNEYKDELGLPQNDADGESGGG